MQQQSLRWQGALSSWVDLISPFSPPKRGGGNGLCVRFNMKARYGCNPFTQDNQSLPQSPLCLPLSHRSFGLRYSLFNLSLKQTPPLSQTCSQNRGWWITIHSWVINEAYCIHISSVIPIHSQDFPCKQTGVLHLTNEIFNMNFPRKHLSQ